MLFVFLLLLLFFALCNHIEIKLSYLHFHVERNENGLNSGEHSINDEEVSLANYNYLRKISSQDERATAIYFQIRVVIGQQTFVCVHKIPIKQ